MPTPIVRGRPRRSARGQSALLALAIAAVLCAGATSAHAQWPPATSNLPVCQMPGAQIYRTAVSDDAGGMYVAWSDGRFVVTDIYVQHVLSDGSIAWRLNGYPICAAPGRQEQPVLASDRAGGVYVVWRDFRSDANGDIYAQHMGPAGLPTWVYNGVAVCGAADEQVNPVVAPVITSEGVGGVIVAWEDYRLGVQIYAQRLDTAGVAQWAADGVPANASLLAQFSPSIATDDSGGAYVAWAQQTADGYDIAAQHVGADGQPLWAAAGAPICVAPGNQYWPLTVAARDNGAWFVWEDARGSAIQVFAQRADYAGNLMFPADGLPVAASAGDQTSPSAASDSTGGLVLAWADARAGADVYAQRLEPSGLATWGGDGLAVCTGSGTHMFPSVAGDGTGGAIIAWEDARGSTGVDIFAQRVTRDAQPVWAVNGQAVTTAASNQYQATVVSSGDTTGVIVWSDTRYGNVDLFAQRVPLADGTSAVGPSSAAARCLSVAPNPARDQAAFAFELTTSGAGEISIFDAAGRRVRTLAHSEFDHGDHRVAWDARDEAGRHCAQGVYFVRLTQNGRTLATRTIALQR